MDKVNQSSSLAAGRNGMALEPNEPSRDDRYTKSSAGTVRSSGPEYHDTTARGGYGVQE